MDPMSWVSLVVGVFGIISSIAAIFRFSNERRDANIAEGERRQEIRQMHDEIAAACGKQEAAAIERQVNDAFGRIRAMESERITNAEVLSRLATQMEHVVKTTDEIKRKLDEHLQHPAEVEK